MKYIERTFTTPGGTECSLVHHTAKLYTGERELYEQARWAEMAGRCSHMSEWDPEKSPWEFLYRIVSKGHLSVLRHINIRVVFETDRTASHQIVRHSHISWTQESQRYVKYGNKPFAFVLPASRDHKSAMVDNGLIEALGTCVDKYVGMTSAGIPAEEARKVLPGCMRTVLYGTGNAEAWGHFFKMRCDKHAQSDIRCMAQSLLDTLKPMMPGIYDNLKQF